jgi:hypothetical protein
MKNVEIPISEVQESLMKYQVTVDSWRLYLYCSICKETIAGPGYMQASLAAIVTKADQHDKEAHGEGIKVT